MSAGELADRFDVSKPTMSAHFSVLREAGLIDASKHGKSIVYRLTHVGARRGADGARPGGRARHGAGGTAGRASNEGREDMTDKQKQLAWALAGAAVLILLPLGAIAARSWGLVEDPGHDLPGRALRHRRRPDRRRLRQYRAAQAGPLRSRFAAPGAPGRRRSASPAGCSCSAASPTRRSGRSSRRSTSRPCSRWCRSSWRLLLVFHPLRPPQNGACLAASRQSAPGLNGSDQARYAREPEHGGPQMLGTILIIVLILHSARARCPPGATAAAGATARPACSALVLIIVVILVLLGRI